MSIADKLLALQAMNKRYRKYQSYFYVVLIVVGLSIVAFTEFTSFTPIHLPFLMVMTFIALLSSYFIFIMAGIRAGLEKSCKLFKELE